MSDGLFVGVAVTISLLLLAIVTLTLLMLRKSSSVRVPIVAPSDPLEQRRLYLLRKARNLSGAKACCKCRHWDLDAGRAAILQNPAFAAAAQTLSPSRMGRKVDDTTQPSLPIAVDTWELIGVCEIESCGRHAIDHCDSFERVLQEQP